jgi:hypothetical protein
VVTLPIVCLVMVYVLRRSHAEVLPAFKFFLDNLPLTLPVLTVVLSIMLRPDELTRLDGWLNLCNHFALGLVSFAIWAFVAGQTVPQYIAINDHAVMNKEHSLLLVFGAFIWAGFCSVVSALASIGDSNQRRKWRLAQVALVAISLSFLWMPFYLFEKKSDVEARLGVSFDEKQFIVSIPYRDPALNQYLGRSTNPITQCAVSRSVSAKSAGEAVRKALAEFRGSASSLQFELPGRPPSPELQRRVDILENLIVASATD